MAKLKLAVLVSGRGSNLQAIIDACKAKDFPAEIVLVFSNDPDAYALTRAKENGIAASGISHKGYPGGREAYDRAVSAEIEKSGAELVVLAGYLRLVTKEFVERWENRLINIHPSLLPAFKGLHAHEQVIEAGVKYSGCTVHFVVPEMDAGPIIAQAVVPVKQTDKVMDLAQRVLRQEHRLYPEVIRWIAEERVVVLPDGTVGVSDVADAEFAHINPTGVIPDT